MGKFEGGRMWIHTLELAGIIPALHGMRNPMNSWDNGDTFSMYNQFGDKTVEIGEADMELCKKLIKGGGEHRKFLRQIHVWANVNMPRYWWSEADTYHFGTKNSCSTMHKIASRDLATADFYLGDNPKEEVCKALIQTIYYINQLRKGYIETKDYEFVRSMKRILPESYLQMRTWDTNYEELMNMYHQRKHHRLNEEWVDVFCNWCESLPYFKELCVEV